MTMIRDVAPPSGAGTYPQPTVVRLWSSHEPTCSSRPCISTAYSRPGCAQSWPPNDRFALSGRTALPGGRSNRISPEKSPPTARWLGCSGNRERIHCVHGMLRSQRLFGVATPSRPEAAPSRGPFVFQDYARSPIAIQRPTFSTGWVICRTRANRRPRARPRRRRPGAGPPL